uniref:Uncharacterized LOC114462481 n=1 Tax=Gouania willdenowi TaxID=441366 RepID=A0A8C5H0C5_GOUWI
MSCVVPEEIVEHGRENNTEDGEVRISKAGLVYNILLWPFSVVVRAYRGVWMLLGFPPQAAMVSPATAATPARHSLSGRKRIGPFTRLLLYVLPRWVQRILGYPVPSSIGCSLSPEIRVSPTKPHGKGSKRKQDDLYEEDDDDEEPPTWVEVLNQDLQEEGPDLDPDYEVSRTVLCLHALFFSIDTGSQKLSFFSLALWTLKVRSIAHTIARKVILR